MSIWVFVLIFQKCNFRTLQYFIDIINIKVKPKLLIDGP